MRTHLKLLIFAYSFVLLAAPSVAFAYVGPGAGFAFLGSAFVFLLTGAMAVATLAFWPLQWCLRRLRGKGIPKNARTRRVVVVGLDGLEPKLVDKYMAENRLPNLKRLAESGSYERLGTTLPPLSPVAWSTFQTGVNPGAHNIFDFLTRDKRFCLPLLSSTRTEVLRRKLSFGPFKWSRVKPSIQLLRKSQPFWKILGKYGVFSNIIRVPISYPPEKFDGNILSAMCTPDLKGTQGSFSFFTTATAEASSSATDTTSASMPELNDTAGEATGGEFCRLERKGEEVHGAIEGPPGPKGNPLTIPFSAKPLADSQQAELLLQGKRYKLSLNKFSPWIEISFRYQPRKHITGIVRFCLRGLTPEFSLYMSPININPEKPALPISHPIFFSQWLSKRQGAYGTLGLMEDTWGRNEHALDDQRFLEQAYLTHEEREEMFFTALEHTREGLCACVFDASDRIQHMFWRYIDPQHPSPRELEGNFERVIPEMYEKMDALVGKVMQRIRPEDVLIVLSDHGFTSFRRCVNVNTWLMQQGYLVLKDGATSGRDYLQDVDWSKTRAFGIGLTGIYLNRKGRERYGIVEPQQVEPLKQQIIAGLQNLKDPKDGKRAIRRVFDSEREYKGAYQPEAPDLIVGTEPGYRVAWESVTGGFSAEVFEDNLKAWSGDHDVCPDAVPGVIFANRKIQAREPAIIDLAPTILDLFRVPIPRYMEGKVVL